MVVANRSVLSILALLGLASPVAARGDGETNMTFSPVHGTQVEYLGTRGDARLWYPGNARLVLGRWKRAAGSNAQGGTICFDYQAGSYNPATGVSGGRWECEPYAIYRDHVVDSVPGDPFRLRSATSVPFDLPRDRTTLDALRSR